MHRSSTGPKKESPSSGMTSEAKETKTSSLLNSFHILSDPYYSYLKPFQLQSSYKGDFGIYQSGPLTRACSLSSQQEATVLVNPHHDERICALTFLHNSNDTIACVTKNEAIICKITVPYREGLRFRTPNEELQKIALEEELKVTGTVKYLALDHDQLIIFAYEREFKGHREDSIGSIIVEDKSQCILIDVKKSCSHAIKFPAFYFSDVEALPSNELVFCGGRNLRIFEQPTLLTKEFKEIDIHFSEPKKFEGARFVNVLPESNLAIFSTPGSIILSTFSEHRFEMVREIELTSARFDRIKPVIISGQLIFWERNQIFAMNLIDAEIALVVEKSDKSVCALFNANNQIGIQFHDGTVEIYQSPFQLTQKAVMEKLPRDPSSIVMSYLFIGKDVKDAAKIISEDEQKKQFVINELKKEISNLVDIFEKLRTKKTSYEKSRDTFFNKTIPQEHEKIYQALHSLLELVNKPGTIDFHECVNQVKKNHPIIKIILEENRAMPVKDSKKGRETEYKEKVEEFGNINKFKDLINKLDAMEPFTKKFIRD